MNLKTKAIYRFSIWLIDWAQLIDGIVGVATLGFVHTTLPGRAMSWMIDNEIKIYNERLSNEPNDSVS